MNFLSALPAGIEPAPHFLANFLLGENFFETCGSRSQSGGTLTSWNKAGAFDYGNFPKSKNGSIIGYFVNDYFANFY